MIGAQQQKPFRYEIRFRRSRRGALYSGLVKGGEDDSLHGLELYVSEVAHDELISPSQDLGGKGDDYGSTYVTLGETIRI